MKYKLSLFLVLLSFFQTQAQSTGQDINNPLEKRNDLKLNILRAVSGAVEVSYDRNLNRKSSLGASVFIPFNQQNPSKDIDVNYFVTSYYRRYFGKKYASGFFIEGFGTLSSIDGKQLMDMDGNLTQKEGPDSIDFSLGLGFGSKWITKNGFVFEANVGLGRLLFNAKETDHDSVYRLGISIGRRF
ncbi:DUF3575 domain-containing protein [Flagellimonas sp. HMM57]|uniref:DUF3575 domain-containing protein n=1 Tax=unclassified Flagellimonas TaxID=2644544 RepID=UPI0013D7E9B7|nr:MULTISPECIES: DUF3575 domain-containing protein [unclassified Flagellimonas]UII76215.1 DUF3575 domain-containing protein [Flagellimonas sp. HMM57]